jgi:hypothetical protein
MPRFYFHVQNGDTILDEMGIELPEVADVLHETAKATAELVAEADEKFWSSTAWKLWVTDQPNGEGESVLTLHFRPMGAARARDTVIHRAARSYQRRPAIRAGRWRV